MSVENYIYMATASLRRGMHLCEAGVDAGPDGAADDPAGRVSAAHEARHVRQRAYLRALPPLLYLFHRHPLDVFCKNIIQL